VNIFLNHSDDNDGGERIVKPIDVATVVLAELHAENRRTDDLTKTMGSDLNYTEITVTFFLNAVAQTLTTYGPGYTFNWPPPSAAVALTYSIAQLIYNIDANTTQP
jgi:hypothetical protein